MLGFWKKDKKVEVEPADVHPAHKKAKPITIAPKPPVETKTESKPPATALKPPAPKPPIGSAPISKTSAAKPPAPVETPDASGLSREEIDALREDEFAEMGIPFKEVIALENFELKGKKIRPINPQEFKKEAQEIQNQCARYCLPFTPTFHEILLCRVESLDHERKCDEAREVGRPLPPSFNLLQIILLREADRQIRTKEKITAGQELSLAGREALASKIDNLAKEIWDQAQEKMIRRQAEKRLRREKGLRGDVALEEPAVQAMIQKITAERQAIQTRRN